MSSIKISGNTSGSVSLVAPITGADRVVNIGGLSVSVLDFGAVGDGIVDDTLAIQAAINYCNSLGGGRVYLPSGTYRKADTSTHIYMYSNITLMGDGDSSIIFHDDKDTNPRMDLILANNVNNVTFRDFKILGTYYTYPNETNASQTITGNTVTKIRIENVTFDSLRLMATAFIYVSDAVVSGCFLSTIARDGLRFDHAERVTISNNTAKWVGDNVIAIHTWNAKPDCKLTGGHTITNNVFENCYDCRLLGVKKLSFTDNAFIRCTGGISCWYDPVYEGDTPLYSIIISNNTFTDTFGVIGSTNTALYVPSPIMIRGPERSKGTSTTFPGRPNSSGVNDTPYSLFDINNVASLNKRNSGLSSIIIANNIIKRTLDLTSAYSTYGYGLRFEHLLPSGPEIFIDPPITEYELIHTGIAIIGSVSNCSITGNIIEGLSNIDSRAIRFMTFNPVDTSYELDNINISNNIFKDCPVGAIYTDLTSAPSITMNIYNNDFNIDPYYRSVGRGANNTWLADNVFAIQVGTSKGVRISGNYFRNCSSPGYREYNSINNIMYADVTSIGFSTSNRGIGNPDHPSTGNIIISIQGDPTVANYEDVTGQPVSGGSTSMPSSGKYVVGQFVKNASVIELGTTPNKYLLTGWMRITTGTNHVLNTDWKECRVLTGN